MIKHVRVKFSLCVCKCVYTMRIYYKSMCIYIYISVCVCGLACLCRLDPIIPMIEKNIEIYRIQQPSLVHLHQIHVQGFETLVLLTSGSHLSFGSSHWSHWSHSVPLVPLVPLVHGAPAAAGDLVGQNESGGYSKCSHYTTPHQGQI